MTDPVVAFYSEKERAAELATTELARLVNAGEAELLPALETAQDTLAHWRRLRIAFDES